jgi:hypothetical protein
MRDPDLVFRAQLAAAALEGAWHRWRVVHGLTADPTPTVSSYVGYSLEEPWGQPRVVFGLAAEDAEQLATLLERHDCVGPVYAAVTTLPGVRESLSGDGGVLGRFSPLPVPRQAPSVIADQPLAGRGWVDRWGEELLVDLSDSGADPGEPVFRQAAAAMQEAAAARLRAQQAEQTEQTGQDDAGASAEVAVPGSLARAATAARAEAEARIRAALAEYRRSAPPDQDSRGPFAPEQFAREQTHPTLEIDLTGDPFASGRPLPEISATDVLEPLPGPETAAGACSPWSRPLSYQDFGDSPDNQDDPPRGRGSRRGRTPRNGDGR